MTTTEQAHKYPVIGTTEWMVQAACKDMGNEIFYPEKGGRSGEAKRVCNGCPVRVECLDFAMQWGSVPYDQGIWGGTTADERHLIRKRRRGR